MKSNDLRKDLGPFACSEVGSGRKAKESGKERGRHCLHGCVVGLNRFVKFAALHRNPIFSSLELGLQFFWEVRVRLQFRIAFHHHKQPGERVGQLILGLLEPLEGLWIGGRHIWIDLDVGHLLARLDHVGKCWFS